MVCHHRYIAQSSWLYEVLPPTSQYIMKLLPMITITLVSLNILLFAAATKDNRRCKEMIQGPLHDDNSTSPFHAYVADENNTVTLRYRIICQEDGAYYTPHTRIITTKDGRHHDRRRSNLFNTVKSPRDNTCSPGNHIRDYTFRITALSDKMNESIAMCALFYQSRSENFTDTCYTSSLAWIILPDRPTTMPPTTPTTTITTADTTTPDITTSMPPTTTNGPTTKITTVDISSSETDSTDDPAPTFISQIQNIIPDSALFTVIAALVAAILVVILIIVVWVLYKRFSKTRTKRKISIQPTGDDRSVVIQAHVGVYECQDIEENDSVDDTKMEQQTLSTVKQRKGQN